jgi:hypothetical protein
VEIIIDRGHIGVGAPTDFAHGGLAEAALREHLASGFKQPVMGLGVLVEFNPILHAFQTPV